MSLAEASTGRAAGLKVASWKQFLVWDSLCSCMILDAIWDWMLVIVVLLLPNIVRFPFSNSSSGVRYSLSLSPFHSHYRCLYLLPSLSYFLFSLALPTKHLVASSWRAVCLQLLDFILVHNSFRTHSVQYTSVCAPTTCDGGNKWLVGCKNPRMNDGRCQDECASNLE